MDIKPIRTEEDYEATLSEILNRLRTLTIDMIRRLHEGLGISAEVWPQKYPLAEESPSDFHFVPYS